MTRFHHAIADGIALVNVLLSLTDEVTIATADRPEDRPKAPRARSTARRMKPSATRVQPPEAPQAQPPKTTHGWDQVADITAAALRPALDTLKRALVIRPSDNESSASKPPGTLSEVLAPTAERIRRSMHAAEDALLGSIHDGYDALTHPNRLLDAATRAISGVDAVAKLLLMKDDPPTVFKGPLGLTKRVAWSRPAHPLDDIKAIGKVVGGTVNDVLLTAVAGAVRRYLVARGESVLDLELRAVVPVNLRPKESPVRLGNNFGLVFLPLPVGIEDPLERLEELRQRMDDIEGSPEAVVVLGLIGAVGKAPAEAERAVVNLFGARGSVVVTNVPGPQRVLSLAGRPIRSMMFWVPQSGRLGLGVAILSYAGNVSIGVASDAGLVPDPERILEGFREELDQLFTLVRKEWAARPTDVDRPLRP